MSYPGLIFRHRLLLINGLLSLLLHVLALVWVDLSLPRPVHRTDTAPLAVRLAPASGVAVVPAPPVVPPAPVAQAVAALDAAPVAPAQPLPAPAPPEPAPATPPPAAAGPAEFTSFAADEAPAPLEAPGYYTSSPSNSARIDYRVTRASPGNASRDDGSARLAWETDGSRYRLELDGVLGELRSEGSLDDQGIAPVRALESLGVGSATTLFDRRANLIASGIGAWSASLMGGSQDTASVVMQLSGMGRSQPMQLQSEVRIWVGGAAGARLERYQEVARETIDTGIGPLETVRVARINAPDTPAAPMFEVWLAPGHAWLPVQLRITAPDGQVLTQTVTAIGED